MTQFLFNDKKFFKPNLDSMVEERKERKNEDMQLN